MIRFDQVEKSYTKELFTSTKRFKALSGLSFHLEQGQTLGLIGGNGAGKSTSIRLIMDFIRPDSGSVQLFGSSPKDSQLRQRVGYLPEIASFPANLTVMDLIRFTAGTCGLSKTVMLERSERWLTHLGLWDVRKKLLRTYSKGMQQRANFVLALMNDPELLILDEPMSGLDPLGRHTIISLIQSLQQQGKTILFCSHILDDVDRLVDEVLLLHKGVKLFSGTPDDLIQQQQARTVEEAFIRCIKTHGDARDE